MTDTEGPSQVPESEVETSVETSPAQDGANNEQNRGNASTSWLWLLAVFAVFVVLGALWFAVFGNPTRIENGSGGGLLGLFGYSSVASPTPAQGNLTEAGVRDVLGRLDYVETTDSPQVEYSNTISSVLAGVDVGDFAQASLAGTSPVMWAPTPGAAVVPVTGTEKAAIVVEALRTFRTLEEATGTPRALDAVMETHLDPGGTLNRTREGALLDVIAQGLSPLGLMFGGQDVDTGWTWQVENVRVTGADTAVVTYTAATTKDNQKWRLIDPSMRYEKKLRFLRDATGRWMLAAWLGEPAFKAKFYGNVAPAGTIVNVDEWWGSL
jgi:hypothetical protein